MIRLLTEKEIQYVLKDFFHLFPNFLDKDLFEANVVHLRKKFYQDLKTKKVEETRIDLLKEKLEEKIVQSIIPYGEAVGVVGAQSLGEKQTQLTLNSFHQAGLSLATVVQGVPRFLELLNTSKEPKNAQNTFFLQKKRQSLYQIKDILSRKIKYISFKDIIKNRFFTFDPQHDIYIESFFYFFPVKERFQRCVYVNYDLDLELLFRNKICLLNVKKKIESEFEDMIIIFSPLHFGKLSVVFDYDNMKEQMNQHDIYVEDNLLEYIEIFYEERLRQKLEDIILDGIPKIKDFHITKNPDTTNQDDLYLVSTCGSNLKELLKLDCIERKSLRTNDLWEIYSLMGIEAVRKFLIEEFNQIVCSDGGFIHNCHISLLVDTMTCNGSITSVSRYGMKKDTASVLSRSSFEESLEHFIKAAFFSEVEPISSVSASVMVGKHSSIGTGLPNLIPDLQILL